MDSTDTRISKLIDYSKICMSTLEHAGLTLALLKPLLEDRELREKHIQSDAFIAHQHIANILFGSFLTEVFSISGGVGRQQASLFTIRSAIETEKDVLLRLEALWSDASITQYDDPEGLLDEMTLVRLRERDVKRNRDHFSKLRKSIMESYDELIRSTLYINSKSARDKILAHKDVRKCNESNTYQSEWFDSFGLKYFHAWFLYGRLAEICKSCHLLLTGRIYAPGFLDDQSEGIAMRFWHNE